MSPRGRFGAVAVAGVLVLGACGGSSDGGGGGGGGGGDAASCPVDALDGATEPVEIVVWHTQQAKPGDTLQALVDEYNGSQDAVVVTLESQGASYEELQRKFESAIPSQELPTMLIFDDTATQTMIDSGVVLPAQACLDASGGDTSAFVDVAVDYYTVDDQLWPVSANLGNALLYYNRGHFEAAGLDPDDPPGTLAEVRAAAEAIEAAGVAETPLVHEFAAWKTEFWLTGAVADMVDNDNGRGDGETTAAALEGNEAALELFTWFDEMDADGLLLPVARAEGAIDHYLAMASENASMLIESSSAATSVEAFLGGNLDTDDLDAGADLDAAEVSGLDLDAGVFPGIDEPGRTQMGGAAWYITSTGTDEEIAAAWDFAQFMNTPAAQAQMLIGGSYLPYVSAANDEADVVEFYGASMSGRWLKLANDQIGEIDPAFPGPLIGPYYDVRKSLEEAQDELMFGGATPEEAIAAAQEGITAALELYNEETF